MLQSFARNLCLETRSKLSFRLVACYTMSHKPINREVDSDDCLETYRHVFSPDMLKDKVAFVTGGGSGIGFRITELLMRHGCNTAIASRKLEKVQNAAEKLKKATGRECLALQMDVRKPDEIAKTVDEILGHYNKIDILVNNAAGNFLALAENLSANAFKTVMEIDTQGTFNSSKTVFDKYFKEHGGNIISISATLAYKGLRMQTHAGCAKAAIDAMAKHFAVEWGQYGIRVNNIAPGPIGGTEGMRKLGGNIEDAARHARANIPLERWGQKTEIAEAVLYLSSSASSYVTGTVLVVDGGDWLTSANSVQQIKEMMKANM